jgi:hypothetical protein
MMEKFFSNSAHPGIPCCSYKPLPVTRAKFTSTVNQIEVEHQKNAEFLMNPYPTHEYNEFHKLASTILQVAKDLSIHESRGMRPEQMDLEHGQEVILYGTSHLCAAVDVWIEAAQTDQICCNSGWCGACPRLILKAYTFQKQTTLTESGGT